MARLIHTDTFDSAGRPVDRDHIHTSQRAAVAWLGETVARGDLAEMYVDLSLVATFRRADDGTLARRRV